MAGTEYPARLRTLARTMYGDGDSWDAVAIHRYMLLNAERGERVPAVSTIRVWIKDDQNAEHHRRVERERKRRHRARAAGTAPKVIRSKQRDPESREIDRRLLALRQAGLSYSAIATVVAIYHGVQLGTETIRYRCRRDGAAPAPRGIAQQATAACPATAQS